MIRLRTLGATLFALSLAGASSAYAAPITWTDWSGSASAAPSATTTTVTGSLGLGTGVTVTYSGQLNGITNEPNWTPTTSYADGTIVDNAPPKAFYSVVEGINGGGSQTESFTFSQAVLNPVMSFWSIGNGGDQISLNFTSPFTIVACGPGSNYGGGCITQTGDDVLGAEGNGTIQFSGTFTSIDFTVPSSEFYYALQVGAPALAPPTVPEPSSLALLGTGILGVVGAVRRKFRG